MKDQNKKSLNQIDRIIEKERQLASKIIPEKLLKSRLKKKLENQSVKIPHSDRRRLKIIATASSISFFIFAGIIILIFVQKENYENATISSMAQFFEETPGVKNLIQMNLERSDIFPYESMVAKTELKSIMKTIQDFRVAYPSPSLKESERVSWRNSPHYDYSQKIEILFHKKVIHKVMYQFLNKEKEGKNG